jgi:hypothetical protein
MEFPKEIVILKQRKGKGSVRNESYFIIFKQN